MNTQAPAVRARRTTLLIGGAGLLYLVFLYIVIFNGRAPMPTTGGAVFDNPGPPQVIISLRNDDLTLLSDPVHEGAVLNAFWKYRIPQIFSFIPYPGHQKVFRSAPAGAPSIADSLRSWYRAGKIDFALHGYSHEKSDASAGEFDGLSYEVQKERIAEGKRFADSVLAANVRAFVPPWNQADVNTLRACRAAGIDLFSSYLGLPSVEGVVYVNANTILFPDVGHSTGYVRPPTTTRILDHTLSQVLDRALNPQGTTFMIVFYHSRTDFSRDSDFINLDTLLSSLVRNPRVHFASMREIAEKYPVQLAAYSRAGLNLQEGHIADYRARPYAKVFAAVLRLLGSRLASEGMFDDALKEFWGGQYRQVSTLCVSLTEASNRYVSWGRGIAAAGVLVCAGALALIGRKKGIVVLGSVLSGTIVAALCLNLLLRVSAERMLELNMVLGIIGVSLLVLLFVHRVARS